MQFMQISKDRMQSFYWVLKDMCYLKKKKSCHKLHNTEKYELDYQPKPKTQTNDSSSINWA